MAVAVAAVACNVYGGTALVFLTSIVAVSSGRVVPAPGGVLIRGGDGAVIGAVGISGDAGENDEVSAVAGIEAAGLKADPGGTKK